MRLRLVPLVLVAVAVVVCGAAPAPAASSASSCDADGECGVEMPYRLLGRTGLRVSALSYGAWVTFGTTLGVDNAYDIMKTAFNAGVNFFDNAEAYASGEAETVMGKVLARGVADGVWRRSDLVISTKIFWGGSGPNDRGLSRKHLVEGLTASLHRLQLEYVDIVFCHRPDPATPMEEVVTTMNHLIARGKVFYWGTSEWSAEQIRHAHAVADRLHLIGPSAEQPEYSLLIRKRFEVEYRPLFDDVGMGSTIWSPLASGILTNKYRDGVPADSRLATNPRLRKRFVDQGEKGDFDDIIRRVAAMADVADTVGCTPAQFAIAWTLLNPDVSTVILGATKVSQLQENLAALACVITPAAAEVVEAVMDNKPVGVRDFRTW